MLRALISFVKSPLHSFPALAAAIGCLVSGYSTWNGVSEIFPRFTYSVVAALGLAAIIQLGMLTSTLAFREQPRLRPMLGSIVAITVLMSSFTSYVFYFRGFSEETIAKERQIERHESLRQYVVAARGQTAAALGTLREAGAELERRLEIEEATGGGLRNLSNPYLQKLIAESDLAVDLRRVESGAGERYRFLSTVLPRVEQMEREVSAALDRIDTELAALTSDAEVDQSALRALYSRVSAAVPAERIREVRGDFVVPAVDPALLDAQPMVEEEYWQRAVADLVVRRTPAAIVFAFIAVFIDLMIVFFAFIAGESHREAAVDARLTPRHWLDLAYEERIGAGVRRWLQALDGARMTRGNVLLHRVNLSSLDDPRDTQCRHFLRQDGYLRQEILEDGEAHWWITDGAYAGLVELAREATAQRAAAGAAVAAGPVEDLSSG